MIKKKGDFDLKKLKREFESAKKKLPTLVANEIKNHFVGGFRTGGGRTDASRGGWKQRGFTLKKNKGRAILTQSGDLRRSIQVRQKTIERIVVGTSGIKYANTHNKGEKIPITPKMRKFFYAMMMLAGQGKMMSNIATKKTTGTSIKLDSTAASEARFWKGMYRHKGNTITIPQREFIGKSKMLEKKIEVIIRRTMPK